MPRKRKRVQTVSNQRNKRQKVDKQGCAGPHEPSPYVHHNILSSYYPRVCTLRNYLLTSLPTTSRLRRRTLTSYREDNVASILDTCLVGILKQSSLVVRETRKAEYVTFTQTQPRVSRSNTGHPQACSIDELVDFVIWSLFKNESTSIGRPRHILCHGLQRGAVHGDGSGATPTSLPGIVRRHPNDNVAALKCPPWSDVLLLLGADAEVIFASLLLDCGIFKQVKSGNDNYFQLSGIPLSELPRNRESSIPISHNPPDEQITKPGAIRFVRHRMLYARPSLSATRKVKIGLHHAHVLQRVADASDPRQAVHLLKYVFPRQFGLHNVFTSRVDREETVQKLKDYTFREQEITAKQKRSLIWIPRRLRGSPLRLVQKIHQRHQHCSYDQLLKHYCPIFTDQKASIEFSARDSQLSISGSEAFITQISSKGKSDNRVASLATKYDGDASFLAHATPTARVSAFCRAAISKLLPRDAFGTRLDGQRNLDLIMRKLEDFVQMRRFESMTLHQATQGMHLTSIAWLSQSVNSKRKLCRSEHLKRLEILHELIYYIFDSLLVPIIRAHFYVTESSTNRHQLFYFRQDVWRKLSEPSLAALALNMYTPIKPREARHKLLTQSLGYSHLRLLPKETGARPITNLKRKQLKLASGKRVLGPSINTQLAPLFSILNYERGHDPKLLGSAMLSVNDIHGKMANFKARIPATSRLYFAKVDIRSCFDSIPQTQLLELVQLLFSEPSYRTTKHMEVKSLDHGRPTTETGLRRKFVGVARPAHDRAVVSEAVIEDLATKKQHAIFSDLGHTRVWSRTTILKLLRDHVGDSMVKVSKKYMKQIDGIPQGSVLSSLLCSYFYGAFERRELDFLDPRSCLLLRLIDDFLLVTTDIKLARQFLEVMANGDKQFGIQVNPQKSLTNFDVTIHGHKVPRLQAGTAFPYCGMRIDVKTLELGKDREKKDNFVRNSLTVESSSKQGTVLKRKTLSSLKIQMHSMLLDMRLNGRNQVLSTLIGNFTESAMKLHQYLAGLATRNRPSQGHIRGLIEDLVTAGWKICRAKNGSSGAVKHITRTQMCWMAATAFEQVFGRKQSQYRELLAWLRELREASQCTMSMDSVVLDQLLKDNGEAFRSYVY